MSEAHTGTMAALEALDAEHGEALKALHAEYKAKRARAVVAHQKARKKVIADMKRLRVSAPMLGPWYVCRWPHEPAEEAWHRDNARAQNSRYIATVFAHTDPPMWMVSHPKKWSVNARGTAPTKEAAMEAVDAWLLEHGVELEAAP